ncbi:plasmid mobilization relaxosome protein MobC [Kitasatospora sp. MBT63]|uniref:plasmid mobilization relaxosome protein MobC n=1 Tax=Kitasatospora sp. MBT63 TaxID=1444768 RepID=UPI000689BF43|nr:plasmid mobilization relaxosome protein MobC [Kitasatospora sp. MBT63]
MAKGGQGRLTEAGQRTHTVSVRLTPEELEKWHTARRRTARKELGAWVRATVEEALNGHPGIHGDVAQVPEVNHAVFLQLAALGNNLNQLAFVANTSGSVPAELHARLEAAIEAVGDAALAVRGLRPLTGPAGLAEHHQEHDDVDQADESGR